MFVGREQELSVLQSRFERMLAGNGSVLFLSGEAGLGKTTLVHEWWNGARASRPAEGARASSPRTRSQRANPEALASSPPHHSANPEVRAGKPALPSAAIFLEAACSIPIGGVEVGEMQAMQPWTDIIAQLQREEIRESRGVSFRKLLKDVAPSLIGFVPVVGEVARVAVEVYQSFNEQRSAPSHAEAHAQAQNQQQIFQQYVNLMARVSETQPLVLFLDDLHWADASSVNMLFYLARQLAGKKILVIGTYRGDEIAAANQGKGHHVLTIKNEILRYEAGEELVLGYLDQSAIRGLLRLMFPAYTVDDRFESWLSRVSDGNALFVTQFIRTLSEDGLLSPDGAFTGSYEAVGVPRTALAVVEERMRRLDDETREVLSYATVEGEEFTAHVLEQLAERKPMQLLKDLQRGLKAGVIAERGASRLFGNKPTSAFRFSHALFHRVLYDSLMDAQRTFLHRACFDILNDEWARHAGAVETALASKLLVHAEKCEEWAVVGAVALRTARQYWNSFADVEASEMIAAVHNAVAQLPAASAAERAALDGEAWMLSGEIDKLHARYESALDALHAARGLFTGAGDTLRAIDATVAHAAVLFLRGRHDEAMAEAADTLAVAEAAQYHAGVAGALNTMGNVHGAREEFDAALAYFLRSRDEFATLGDERGAATALNNIGAIHYLCGNHEAALGPYEECLAIVTRIGARATQADTVHNIGNIHYSRGDLDKALAAYRESLTIKREIGDRAGEARAQHNISVVCFTMGDEARAFESMESCLSICREIGYGTEEASALSNMGSMHKTRGDLVAARAALERSLALCRELHLRQLEGELLCELGMLIEAEADACAGDLRAATLYEALRLLEQGAALLQELRDPEAEKYAAEVTRMKAL